MSLNNQNKLAELRKKMESYHKEDFELNKIYNSLKNRKKVNTINKIATAKQINATNKIVCHEKREAINNELENSQLLTSIEENETRWLIEHQNNTQKEIIDIDEEVENSNLMELLNKSQPCQSSLTVKIETIDDLKQKKTLTQKKKKEVEIKRREAPIKKINNKKQLGTCTVVPAPA